MYFSDKKRRIQHIFCIFFAAFWRKLPKFVFFVRMGEMIRLNNNRILYR